MDRWNVTRLVLLNISSKFPWIQRHWASAKLNISKVYCIAELILHYLAVRRGKFYHELFPTNVFSTSALLSIKRSCSWWHFSKGIPSAKFKGVPGSALPPISHGSPANYSVRLRRSSRFSSKGPRLVSCIVYRMLVLLAASTFSYMALLNCTLFIAPWSVKPSYLINVDTIWDTTPKRFHVRLDRIEYVYRNQANNWPHRTDPAVLNKITLLLMTNSNYKNFLLKISSV